MRCAYFATIGQSFDWREPIGLQERLEGRSSHNGEFSVMSRESSRGNSASTLFFLAGCSSSVFVYIVFRNSAATLCLFVQQQLLHVRDLSSNLIGWLVSSRSEGGKNRHTGRKKNSCFFAPRMIAPDVNSPIGIYCLDLKAFNKKQSKSAHPIGKKLNVGARPHKNMNQKIKVGTP